MQSQSLPLGTTARGIRGVITGLLINRSNVDAAQLSVDRMMRKLGPITDDEMVEITITVRKWEPYIGD